MTSPTLVAMALLTCLRVPQVQPSESKPVRTEAPRDGTRVLRGTAVVVDRSGVEHADQDGLFRALQWPTGVVEIPVRAGHFEGNVGLEAPLEHPSLVLGGRSVDLDDPKLSGLANDAIDLRGEWIDDEVLHVVDADTDAELKECEWLLFPGSLACPELDATRDLPEERAKGLASPIHLARYGRYRVRAPGHAWRVYRHFGMRDPKASEPTLALPRACTVDVDLPEPGPGPRRWFVLDSTDDPGWMSLAAPADRRIHLDSIPPGELRLRWLLSFDLKPWFRNEVTLSSATVMLHSGGAGHVVLGPEVVPADLMEDGTVERDGILWIAGRSGDSPPPSGSLTFTCWREPRLGERVDTTNGLDSIERMTGAGFDSSTGTIQCDVREGRFHVRVPWASMLRVTEATLEGVRWPLGRTALLFETKPDPVEVALPEPQTLAGPATTLHVIAAGSTEELDDVIVIRSTFERVAEERLFRADHPGPCEAGADVCAKGSSPLLLRDSTGSRDQEPLFIRADGYAWKRLDHDWRKGGERTIELESACELSITLVPPIEASGLQLAIYRTRGPDVEIQELREVIASLVAQPLDDQERARERSELVKAIAELQSETPAAALVRYCGRPLLRTSPQPSGASNVDGLPRGLLVVALLNPVNRSIPIGASIVDARSGGRFEVVVKLDPDAIRPSVPLTGTVIVPEQWGDGPQTLRVQPLDVTRVTIQPSIELPLDPSTTRDRGHGGQWWNAGGVLPGSYRVAVALPNDAEKSGDYAARLEVGEGGATDVRIAVPPPSDVELALVDDATGEPVAIDSIEVAREDAVPAPGSIRGLSSSLTRRSEIARLRVPSGRVMVTTRDRRYVDAATPFDLTPGRNRVTLRLTRACGIHVVLTKDGAPIAWNDDIDLTVEELGSDGRPIDLDYEFENEFKVRHAGRYRLTFDSGEEEEVSIAPVEVTVPANEIVQLLVPIRSR